jgi:hypothetical protein
MFTLVFAAQYRELKGRGSYAMVCGVRSPRAIERLGINLPLFFLISRTSKLKLYSLFLWFSWGYLLSALTVVRIHHRPCDLLFHPLLCPAGSNRSLTSGDPSSQKVTLLVVFGPARASVFPLCYRPLSCWARRRAFDWFPSIARRWRSTLTVSSLSLRDRHHIYAQGTPIPWLSLLASATRLGNGNPPNRVRISDFQCYLALRLTVDSGPRDNQLRFKALASLG